MPGNFVGSSLVQSETEWRFVLPHLSRHVVPPSQLIGKAVPKCVEDKATNSAERVRCKELDFCIGVVGLHLSCGVHLDPLEIDGLCSDGLTHLDRVASSVHHSWCEGANKSGR